MTNYPTTLKELQEELHKYSDVGRADRPFRFAIAISQLGNIAMHLTHDPKENPNARPYGTPAGHLSDAGHALAQLIIYLDSSGIDIQEALNLALDAIREKDGLKRKASNDGKVVGVVACEGYLEGTAWVDPSMSRDDSDKPYDAILITSHPYSDARLKKYSAVVTDHGGTACHAAVVCRENNIPCITGTGNATTLIKDGNKIVFDANGQRGRVFWYDK
jgi:phosphohistidine swiveling domain-containing protein